MAPSKYWLAQWVDENGIKSDWEIDNLLRHEENIRRLIESVEQAAQQISAGQIDYPNPAEISDSIVAGRSLDLSGSVSCLGYGCLRREIDSTFTRVWHYFDRIVVEGLSPLKLKYQFEQARGVDHRHDALHAIREQVRVLLYLRDIGADQYTVFTHKSFSSCQDHWKEHAKDLGIFDALRGEVGHNKTVGELVNSSDFTIEPTGNIHTWKMTLTGRLFAGSLSTLIWSDTEPTREGIACILISDYATAMISDVGLAHNLGLPLVEPVRIPWIGNGKPQKRPVNEEDVVLQLDLPVFRSLTPKDFLKLREDERPYFERFRAALRAEIRERLITQDKSQSAQTVARSIEEDYLRPGLADIERRVRSSRKALGKKSSVTLSIGTSAAIVGALAYVPLVIPTGVAAIAASVPFINKYMDDRNSIEIEDLYFLWHIDKRAAHA